MSLNEDRYFAAISQLENSCFGDEIFKQIVSGGMNHNEDLTPRYLNSLEVLTENGWRKDVLPVMPVQIYSHCMVAINSTFLMVIGGFQNGTHFKNNTYFLDLNKSSWFEGPPLRTGRNGHRCSRIRLNDSSVTSQYGVIVVGGINSTVTNPKPIASTEILDDGSNEWRPGPELPFGLAGSGILFANNVQ
jgi:hypothetical protein